MAQADPSAAFGEAGLTRTINKDPSEPMLSIESGGVEAKRGALPT